MTDYSATLLHVYNCAPVEVFTNPRRREKIKNYERLLSELFPMRKQLEAFVNIGPKILKKTTEKGSKTEGGTSSPNVEDIDCEFFLLTQSLCVVFLQT